MENTKKVWNAEISFIFNDPIISAEELIKKLQSTIDLGYPMVEVDTSGSLEFYQSVYFCPFRLEPLSDEEVRQTEIQSLERIVNESKEKAAKLTRMAAEQEIKLNNLKNS